MRYSFDARHNRSSMSCTVDAPTAALAWVHGVDRASETFGCDSDLRAAFQGDEMFCQMMPITADLDDDCRNVLTGRVTLDFGLVPTCGACGLCEQDHVCDLDPARS